MSEARRHKSVPTCDRQVGSRCADILEDAANMAAVAPTRDAVGKPRGVHRDLTRSFSRGGSPRPRIDWVESRHLLRLQATESLRARHANRRVEAANARVSDPNETPTDRFVTNVEYPSCHRSQAVETTIRHGRTWCCCPHVTTTGTARPDARPPHGLGPVSYRTPRGFCVRVSQN